MTTPDKNQTVVPANGLISIGAVLEIAKVPASTWHGWVAKGIAPKGVKMGPRKTLWYESEVLAFAGADPGMPRPPTAPPLPSGATLRDHFAGQALVGVVSRLEDLPGNDEIATACYQMADAMMRARALK